MATTLTLPKNKVLISVDELQRFKKIDLIFRDFLNYFEHISDIKEARDEVSRGKVISQEDLFRQLKI